MCVLLAYCINAFNACCFSCCILSKNKNQLSTVESKLEEQCESAQKNNSKIDWFAGFTDRIHCKPQQWANIYNTKCWCHTGNHSTIDIWQKITRDNIIANSWRKKLVLTHNELEINQIDSKGENQWITGKKQTWRKMRLSTE